ncbi:MAG TPA: ADP-ribosylglycohydrolase family protein [Spirochaetota bacterium]|nr:ADP-ribosylglycohydrolase family protein [Spirochaetota bacterium]HPG52038.1 ADP-ribosylglycohydrolase family protein [Spirochaetota bacterium]HPN12109.1 ADP-ribosylglycohydrolase family protein [Spirochaetota bacterium]
MSDITPAIIFSIIAGDALGTPLDGMSRGHIKSCFGQLSGYPDPEPALKGKMDRWKKPGLYSSISQFMLLLGMSCLRKGSCIDAFFRSMTDSPALAENGYDIFRYPDGIESGFIARCKDRVGGPVQSAYPSTRILAALAPLAFRRTAPAEILADATGFLRLFTADPKTLAAGLLHVFLLKSLAEDGQGGPDPVRAAVACAAALEEMIASDCSAQVFASGANPGVLAAEVRVLAEILALVAGADSPGAAEDLICSHLNRTIPNRITRATVNMPSALLPYAVAFTSFYRDDGRILYRAAAEGGSSAPFASIVGSLAASFSGAAAAPEELLQGLVNRKRISTTADNLAAGAPGPDLAEEFIRAEASLTRKADEELRARTRHLKKKPEKKSPSRADREQALARHVVESWTKIDKAKWKKERKQRGQNGES